MYFVIEISPSGQPGQLKPANSFNDAKEYCGVIARHNGVTESRIKRDILDDDTEPGTWFPTDPGLNTDVSGVWVVMDEAQ